ncbi:hypothetical protein AJ78_02027 [Emergomyces pasteurianus Ep9510]|uniref:Uncharacterized protein n=1 Tax=Emergomyces pasteurianus Ep9510 TaxID=1447872 RepID=A0A1J9PPU6_9EURO|nr:hypothetical protein AJ78_02027 [Emergomyces pasteurianus Ep9510]
MTSDFRIETFEVGYVFGMSCSNPKKISPTILTDSRLVAGSSGCDKGAIHDRRPLAAQTDQISMADRPLTRVRQQSDRESSYYQNTEVTSTSCTDESSDDWQPQTPNQSKSSR